MDSATQYWSERAALEWMVELGADEAICDAPVDRYALSAKAEVTKPTPATPEAASQPTSAPEIDPVKLAEAAAAQASDLPALHAAIAGFDHCELKRGARNTVFADGTPEARVMVIGEAPGRDEDREGRPFVGRAGQLLDRMFAAIDMARTAEDPKQSIYITNILPWRPPQNRDPKPEEIAMMTPFVRRHIALVDPEVIVVMGNISCQALLGKRGITRLRGQWTETCGRPALPMFHPAYLLRQPHAKRDAWSDLLDLQARLEAP